MGVDLHIHTNASDGSFSPLEIFALAEERRLAAISFTDHDTIDGVKAIVDADVTSSVRFLAGVEITAEPPPDFDLSDSLHIFGYGISIDDVELTSLLLKAL